MPTLRAKPLVSARQPVIILGMHRSGTSIVAESLDRLGLFVGHELQEDHESVYFLAINETIFSRVNAAWDNPLPVSSLMANESAMDMTAAAVGADLASRRIRPFFGWKRYLKHRSLAELTQAWGWKDPRTVFTLPLWLKLFPAAKLVYVLRNGVDVAASLVTREQRLLEGREKKFEERLNRFSNRSRLERAGYKGSARCLTLAGGFELWQEYLQAADANLAEQENPLLTVRFEDFAKEPAKHIKEMASFCELTADDAAIQSAAARVDNTRASAFSRDPKLAAFHETIRNNAAMVRYGYGQ